MTPIKIALSKHQADAIRADHQELTQLERLRQVKVEANARHTSTIVLDNGHFPDNMERYDLAEESGVTYMVLHPKPEPTSAAASPVGE